MGPQSRFELRTPRSPLDQGRPGHRIHLQHPVHPTQIHGHRPGEVVVEVRGDPAHHRGTASERNQRRILFACPLQQGHHLGLVAGIGHHIGRVGEIPGEDPDRIGLGLSETVQDPFVGLLCAQRRQAARRAQAWRGKVYLINGRRPRAGSAHDAEILGEPRQQPFPVLRRQTIPLVSPSPVFESLCHRLSTCSVHMAGMGVKAYPGPRNRWAMRDGQAVGG